LYILNVFFVPGKIISSFSRKYKSQLEIEQSEIEILLEGIFESFDFHKSFYILNKKKKKEMNL